MNAERLETVRGTGQPGCGSFGTVEARETAKAMER